MNPNSKNPMARYFAGQQAKADKSLADLDRAERVLKEVNKIMEGWKP